MFIFITERIASSCIFQANGGSDITGINFFNLFTLISVHLKNTSNTLFLALCRVVYIRTCCNNAGIDTEKGKLANKGIGHNLKPKRRKRFGIRRNSFYFSSRINVNTLYCRNIERRRHVINNCIEQVLNTLVFKRRSADYGTELNSYRTCTDCRHNFIFCQHFSTKILFHKSIVMTRNLFDHLFTIFIGFIKKFSWNFYFVILGTERLIIPNDCLHPNKVNNPLEILFLTNRYLNRKRISLQTVLNHLYATEEIGPDSVHFINKCKTRNTVFISLTPDCFRLWLNPAYRTKYRYRAIKNPERTLDFNSEVNMPRCVNNINVIISPAASCCSRGNGNTTLLLLLHPVHSSGAFMDFADLMRNTGIIQDTFCCCGFAGVNVCHDADISIFFKR